MKTTIVFEINELDVDRYEDLLEEIKTYTEFLEGEFDCEVSSTEINNQLTPYEQYNKVRQQAESDAIEDLRDKSFR